jgi:hypothetical protein
MTAREIEVAVSKHFDYRRNLIVPNVGSGLGLHECDLLILSDAGYATEVEIKISRGDLLRDKAKDHGHQSDIIKAFWFAVPEVLADYALARIPEEAGVLAVRDCADAQVSYSHPRVRIVRPAVIRQHSRAFTSAERYQLARLGLMRYWTLRGDHFKPDVAQGEVSA